jgi:hypothetical protein
MTTATAPEHTHRHVKTSLPPEAHNPGSKPLATFLGVFSIGLGLAELLRPKTVEKATGVHSRMLLRGYGLREIASGLGILTTDRPAFWLWSRVAGDVIDMATLAAAYADGGPRDRERAVRAALAVAPIAVLDVLCAAQHTHGDYDGTAV